MMATVLKFSEEEKVKLPKQHNNVVLTPIPANGGGWYFAPDKANVLDEYEVQYTEVEHSTVRVIAEPKDQCSRCEEQYPEGEIKDERGLCKFCVASEDKASKKTARQARVDFLKEESAGTPIEEHVLTLLKHYAAETHEYIETGSTVLKDAIENETDPTILALLDIVLVEDWNYTVRQSILTRITI